MNGYVVTIYQKVPLNENIIVFKRVGLARNVFIKTKNGLDEITYYNENQERITLEYMDNEYVIVSDDQYCYGYPMDMDKLQSMYPDIKTEAKLVDKYYNEISQVINIAYYDKESDTVKIVVTNEEILKQQDENDLFNCFKIEYESDDIKKAVMPLNDLKKIIELSKKGKTNILKNHLLKIDNYIKKQNKIVYNIEKEEKKKNNKEKDLALSLEELNDLIGLENIKEEIIKLVKYLQFRAKVGFKLKLEPINLHMFFTGNPGTGKTTVARIISEILYNMGYIKNNSLLEITPKDLIAGYVGQTAIKTAEVLKKNKGGVIFIDEAYILAKGSNNFSQEALVEILKELEKNETVFIFAGYRDEMQLLMNMNPGLTSRIGYYMEYNDYSKEELYQIFEMKVKKMGFIIQDELKEKIINNLEKAINNEHFGNGRYIDKLIDKLILEHAINTEKYKRKKELITLTEKDFNENVENALIFKQKVKTIGFI